MKINKKYKKLNLFTNWLICFSIILFSIETIPELHIKYRSFFFYGEALITTIFSIEYLLRVLFAKKKLKYIFSFYGLVDLVAILPFYLFYGAHINSIKILRILKILRSLKLFRVNKAIRRLKSSFLMIRGELSILFFISLSLLYVSALGIYLCEHQAQPEKFKSIFHGLWWAVATLTTVGYGDVYPITFGGRIFTSIILMVGLGLISVPSGLFASALMRSKE